MAGHKIVRQATRYHDRAQDNTVDTRFTAGHKKTWQTQNIMAGDQTTLADQIYHGRVRGTMADIRCKGRAQDDNTNRGYHNRVQNHTADTKDNIANDLKQGTRQHERHQASWYS